MSQAHRLIAPSPIAGDPVDEIFGEPLRVAWTSQFRQRLLGIIAPAFNPSREHADLKFLYAVRELTNTAQDGLVAAFKTNVGCIVPADGHDKDDEVIMTPVYGIVPTPFFRAAAEGVQRLGDRTLETPLFFDEAVRELRRGEKPSYGTWLLNDLKCLATIDVHLFNRLARLFGFNLDGLQAVADKPVFVMTPRQSRGLMERHLPANAAAQLRLPVNG